MNKDNLCLMYKNTLVAILGKCLEVVNPDLLPVHLQDDPDIKAVEGWLRSREINSARKSVLKLSDCTGIGGHDCSLESHALSLSDPYWVQKGSEDLNWADINFYDNPYDDGFGDWILKGDAIPKSFWSPDFTTNGCMEKAWKRIQGVNYLIKENPDNFPSEVICCKLHKAFPALDFVEYMPLTLQKEYSVCKNFLAPGQEFVPAFHIYGAAERPFYMDKYKFLIEQCEIWGIANIKSYLQSMLIFDYLVGNTDRHFGNFGFLRDTGSLAFLGPAPIFDNGSSLSIADTKCGKPFGPDQAERYARHFEYINFSELQNLLPDALDCINEPSEKDKVAEGLQERTETLLKWRDRNVGFHRVMPYQRKEEFIYGDAGKRE